eukprot:253024_1
MLDLNSMTPLCQFYQQTNGCCSGECRDQHMKVQFEYQNMAACIVFKDVPDDVTVGHFVRAVDLDFGGMFYVEKRDAPHIVYLVYRDWDMAQPLIDFGFLSLLTDMGKLTLKAELQSDGYFPWDPDKHRFLSQSRSWHCETGGHGVSSRAKGPGLSMPVEMVGDMGLCSKFQSSSGCSGGDECMFHHVKARDYFPDMAGHIYFRSMPSDMPIEHAIKVLEYTFDGDFFAFFDWSVMELHVIYKTWDMAQTIIDAQYVNFGRFSGTPLSRRVFVASGGYHTWDDLHTRRPDVRQPLEIPPESCIGYYESRDGNTPPAINQRDCYSQKMDCEDPTEIQKLKYEVRRLNEQLNDELNKKKEICNGMIASPPGLSHNLPFDIQQTVSPQTVSPSPQMFNHPPGFIPNMIMPTVSPSNIIPSVGLPPIGIPPIQIDVPESLPHVQPSSTPPGIVPLDLPKLEFDTAYSQSPGPNADQIKTEAANRTECQNPDSNLHSEDNSSPQIRPPTQLLDQLNVQSSSRPADKIKTDHEPLSQTKNRFQNHHSKDSSVKSDSNSQNESTSLITSEALSKPPRKSPNQGDSGEMVLDVSKIGTKISEATEQDNKKTQTDLQLFRNSAENHKIEIANLESKHIAEITSIKEMFNAQLYADQNAHQISLTSQTSKSSRQISDLESIHKSVVRDLKSKHQREISDLESKYAKEVATLTNYYERSAKIQLSESKSGFKSNESLVRERDLERELVRKLRATVKSTKTSCEKKVHDAERKVSEARNICEAESRSKLAQLKDEIRIYKATIKNLKTENDDRLDYVSKKLHFAKKEIKDRTANYDQTIDEMRKVYSVLKSNFEMKIRELNSQHKSTVDGLMSDFHKKLGDSQKKLFDVKLKLREQSSCQPNRPAVSSARVRRPKRALFSSTEVTTASTEVTTGEPHKKRKYSPSADSQTTASDSIPAPKSQVLEYIVAHAHIDGKLMFKVKFVGEPLSGNDWCLEEGMSGADNLIAKYWESPTEYTI